MEGCRWGVALCGLSALLIVCPLGEDVGGLIVLDLKSQQYSPGCIHLELQLISKRISVAKQILEK